MNLEKFEIRHDGRSTSPEMLDILQRMDSGEIVSEEEIESTPEIIEARQQFAEIIEEIGTDSTSNINTEQRESMRMEIREKLQEAGSVVKDENGKTSMMGEVKEERRLDIVIGLPAAGKSSVIVDSLSQEHGSKVIDSDDAKKEIPEFRDGIGANIVHKESAEINDEVFRNAKNNGQNIIIPIIGSNPASVKEKYIDPMKEKGYRVFVHYVEVQPETARARMLGRFITDGRFVDYKNLERYTNEDGSSKCDRSFEVLKEDPNVDGYTHWDNDVEEGEPARLVEAHNVDIPDVEPKDAAVKDDMEMDVEDVSTLEDYESEISFDEDTDADIDVEASFAMGHILDGLEIDVSDYLKADNTEDDTDGFGAVGAEENEDDTDGFGEVDTEEDEDESDYGTSEDDEDWGDE